MATSKLPAKTPDVKLFRSRQRDRKPQLWYARSRQKLLLHPLLANRARFSHTDISVV